MSMAWFFHTYHPDLLATLCGSATAAEIKKFTKVLTNPDEYPDLEEEELEARARLVSEVLTKGIHYQGKTRQEANELDHAVKMLFHWMGMAKALTSKQISNGMTVHVGGELARLAKQ